MRIKSSLLRRGLTGCAALLCAATTSWAQSDVTQPGDTIFASSANSPGSEGVANAIDGKTTKYLNFDSGRDGNQTGTFSPSGFVVIPAVGLTRVTGMSIQSANDGPERDPDVVTLEGSNDTITNYTGGTWETITTISNIAAGFPNRFQTQTFSFENTKPYKSYRWTVQSVRTTPNGCCMQVAEVELLGSVVPQDVSQPGDAIIASSANSPGSEGVANAIDNKTTKYLNFDSGRDGNQIGTFSPSGFVVTPGIGRTLVTGITIQSANDGPERDPDVVLLEGSNDTNITTFASGNWEAITTLSNVAAGFTARFQEQTFLFDNVKPYKSYRWTVQRVRTTPNGCCMQVAEVQLLGTSEPQDITQPGDPIFASSANSPGSEGVANVIDNKTTKYLNFDSGRDGNQIGTFSPSGFAVTPSIGASTVIGMTIQSANDGPERDPDVVRLEGSNDTNITSYASGTWEPITTISNIAAGFTARFQKQEFFFPNPKSYKSYRWTVQSVRTTPNGCCMQVAEVELLAATTGAPASARFLEQPVDTLVLSGQPATFFTTLNGPWPVQWRKNGVPIPGATKTSYTTEPIDATNATNVYDVQIVGREASTPVHAVILAPSANKSVAVSFIGGGANGAPTTVDTNSVIGIWPQAYWNNATGNSGDLPDGTNPFLDSSGAETPIAVNYSAAGTWGAGTGVDAPTDRMLNGLILDNPGGDPATITFSNVPDGAHTVIVYVVSPPLQFQNVNYTVSGTSDQTYYIRAMNSDEYNAAPGWYRGSSTNAASRSIANFVRFDNVHPNSGTITVSVDEITTGYDRGTGVNGIQLILNAPPAGTPPSITTAPQATVAASGATARLSVTASGDNLTYQWRKNGKNLPNGGNISGATSANLVISNFGDADAGIYNVAVFNAAGSALSKNASVSLSKYDITDAAASYFTFDASSGTTAANGLPGAQAGTITGTATWGAGQIGNALTFDGNTYVQVPNFTKGTKQLAVSAWVNVDPSTASDASFVRNAQGALAVGGTNSGLFDFGLVMDANDGTLHLNAKVAVGPNIVQVTDPTAFNLGAWHQVAFSADGAQLTLYVDGKAVAATDYTGTLNTPNTPYLTIGARLSADPDSGVVGLDPTNPNPLVGKIDDVAVWSRAITSAEAGLVYNAGKAGQGAATVKETAPVEENAKLTIARGANGALTITWTGTGYRLQSSDTVKGTYADVPNVTGSTYQVPATTTGNKFYRLIK